MTNLNVFTIKDSAGSELFHILTTRTAREIILEIHKYEDSEKGKATMTWFKENVKGIRMIKVLPDEFKGENQNLYIN